MNFESLYDDLHFSETHPNCSRYLPPVNVADMPEVASPYNSLRRRHEVDVTNTSQVHTFPLQVTKKAERTGSKSCPIDLGTRAVEHSDPSASQTKSRQVSFLLFRTTESAGLLLVHVE
jgi:hypothetical protein